jgi:hypothetical protein
MMSHLAVYIDPYLAATAEVDRSIDPGYLVPACAVGNQLRIAQTAYGSLDGSFWRLGLVLVCQLRVDAVESFMVRAVRQLCAIVHVGGQLILIVGQGPSVPVAEVEG